MSKTKEYKQLKEDLEDIEKMFNPLSKQFNSIKNRPEGRELNLKFRVALSALKRLQDLLEDNCKDTP